MKVAGTEGLQRMLLGHGRERVTAPFQLPATGEVVPQLADQDAGRAFAVAALADIELLACGK